MEGSLGCLFFFGIKLDGVGSFRDIFWAGIENNPALMAYAKRLRRVLAEYGIPYDKKRFSPHIGRGEGKNADILHDIVFPKEMVSDWQEPVRIYNYFYYNYDNRHIPVISFYHPQIIGSHDRLREFYEDMCLIDG